MMKRFLAYITVAIALLGISPLSQAKKVETPSSIISLMEKYSEETDAEFINLKGLLLKFAKPAMKDTPMADMVECLENICIFHVDKFSSEVSKKFNADLAAVLSEYIKVTETKEDKILNSIYMKQADENTISELLVYSTGDGINIVTMIGSIPISELEKMAASETEK
jgi:hypothetical protein